MWLRTANDKILNMNNANMFYYDDAGKSINVNWMGSGTHWDAFALSRETYDDFMVRLNNKDYIYGF